MSISNSEVTLLALERFYQWVSKQKAEGLYFYQEFVLTILFLLTSVEFEKEVSLIRKKLDVPEEWYLSGMKGIGFDRWWKEWNEWCRKSSNNRPSKLELLRGESSRLCKDFKLEFVRYGHLIDFFVYAGDMVALEPLEVGNVFSGEEFRYKARIEIKHIDEFYKEFLPHAPFPEGAYIRFFRDTTKRKLHEFIDRNWDIIKDAQQYLEDYPFSRSRNPRIFKRDVMVFLLHRLGNNAPRISEKIANSLIEQTEEYPDEDAYEDIFTMDDSNIRKVVSDMTNEINNRVLQKP